MKYKNKQTNKKKTVRSSDNYQTRKEEEFPSKKQRAVAIRGISPTMENFTRWPSQNLSDNTKQ